MSLLQLACLSTSTPCDIKRKPNQLNLTNGNKTIEKETLLKNRGVILVAPNEYLSNGPQCLDQQTSVVFRNGLVSRQHVVQILEMFQRMGILGTAPTAPEPTSTPEHRTLIRRHVVKNYVRPIQIGLLYWKFVLGITL